MTEWRSLTATDYLRNDTNTSWTPSTMHFTLANLEPKATTATTTTKRRNVRRKFLGVGINVYENPNNNLNGCVADIQDSANTLKMFGFPASRQKILINEQATTEGILKGLDWLVKDTADGDVLIFHYSGHGSQVADLDNEEHDGYDEIICPYDISWNNKKYITDDQLYQYFTSKVPASVRTDVILDSCFSGSATRSFNMFALGNQGMKQRYLVPPVNHRSRINSMVPAMTDINRFGDKSITSNQNNVLWSGCQEYQVSWELLLNGQVRGAFTFYLMNILRDFRGNASRGEIYSVVRSRMADDGFDQVPNLEIPNEEALNLFPFRKASEVDMMSEIKPKK